MHSYHKYFFQFKWQMFQVNLILLEGNNLKMILGWILKRWKQFNKFFFMRKCWIFDASIDLNTFQNLKFEKISWYMSTPGQNRFKWKVGSQAKDYLNIQYWCLEVQKYKKWKSSNAGNRSCQLNSVRRSANHG